MKYVTTDCGSGTINGPLLPHDEINITANITNIICAIDTDTIFLVIICYIIDLKYMYLLDNEARLS